MMTPDERSRFRGARRLDVGARRSPSPWGWSAATCSRGRARGFWSSSRPFPSSLPYLVLSTPSHRGPGSSVVALVLLFLIGSDGGGSSAGRPWRIGGSLALSASPRRRDDRPRRMTCRSGADASVRGAAVFRDCRSRRSGLSPRAGSRPTSRRHDARCLRPSRRPRRRVPRGASPGGRPLRLPVRRPRVLALLQLETHGDHDDGGDLPAHRRLAQLDGGDPARHATLAAATALLVGGLEFVAWLVRAGVLVNFISETVLIGFKCGVAFQIASTQLPKLFGFPGGHGDFWERCRTSPRHRPDNAVALLVGGAALVLLVFAKRFLPGSPIGLFVVVPGIAVSAAAGPRITG